MKQCARCQKTKPLDHFSEYKSTKGWYRNVCRDCARAYLTAWRKVHPGKVKQYGKAWRDAHLEQARAATSAWDKTHPENKRAQVKRHRAHKLNAPLNDLTHTQWLAIQAVQDHRCAYCGKRCKGHLTQDHVTPLSKGGSHTLHNVVAACKKCNSKKYTGPVLAPVQPLLL